MVKRFTICISCEKPLVQLHKKTGKYIRAMSGFPYCTACFLKHADDPDFQKWIVEKVQRKGVKFI